jgi:DnaJ family protein B protein 4
MSENFYSILEVPETATQEEIKKSYRRLSMEYHPDKNKNPEATAKFQKISEAYETLGDIDKKSQYDMSRQNPFSKNGIGINPMDHIFSNFFNFEGMSPFSHMDSFGPGQPFIHVFHNGHPVNIQIVKNMSKPTAIILNITIPIEKVLTGGKMPIEVERWIAGENNSKVIEKETLYFDIPKGVDEGEIIVIGEKGNITQNGIKGDVKICIHIENNTDFKRRGLDLFYEKTINLKEALCGFSFEIKHITGKIYTIANPEGNVINNGHNKVIPQLGLTRDGSIGNMIIQFNVKFPEKLSKEIVETLKQIDF